MAEMSSRAALRFFFYAMIGVVLLAAAFIVLVFMAMGVFGIGVVRSDLFGVMVISYWLIGLPLALLISWSLVIAPSRAPHA